jgi:hypothetical protein
VKAKKVYVVLIGLIAFGLLAAVLGAYFGMNMLSSKGEEVRKARLNSLALEESERLLAKAKVDIEKYKELAEVARSVVPQDKDQAQTVREIINLANANGVPINQVVFPASSLGTGRPDTQLKPVPGIAGVYSLELTVNSDTGSPVDFSQLVGFLSALENNRRTALVNEIVITPNDSQPGKITFTITLNEYIKP